MLSRVATINRPGQHPEGLTHLVEILRNHEAPNFVGDRGGAGQVQVAVPAPSNLHSAPNQNPNREFDDSQGAYPFSCIMFLNIKEKVKNL